MPVQVLNKAVRDDIYARTVAAVRADIAPDAALDDHTPLLGQCLEFAFHGWRIIRDWPGAPRTLIQAGSAQWPRVPPALDDGVSPTHLPMNGTRSPRSPAWSAAARSRSRGVPTVTWPSACRRSTCGSAARTPGS